MHCQSITLPLLNEKEEFHAVLTLDAELDANFFVEFTLLKIFQFNCTDVEDLKSTKLESRVLRIDAGSTLFTTFDSLSPNRLIFPAQNYFYNRKSVTKQNFDFDKNVNFCKLKTRMSSILYLFFFLFRFQKFLFLQNFYFY